MTTIHSDSIEVSAAEKGAELQSIKGNGIEYLWQGDAAFWNRRSPLLFPNVGALPRRDLRAQRARPTPWATTDSREPAISASPPRPPTGCASSSRATPASLAMYPFDFLLAVAYRVEKNKLFVGWEVANEGAETMFFSIGAHPGFRAPLVAGEKREDYELVFEKRETLVQHFLNADNVRDGNTASFLRGQDRVGLSAALFEKGAVVLADPASRRVTLKSKVSGHFVEVSFPGFPSLGLWSPKDNEHGNCPFVCIEPWYGIMPQADSTQEISKKEGCLGLAPGKSFKAEYSIAIG